MGGIGSGQWTRSNTRLCVEEMARVEIGFLKSRGALNTGANGTITWSCNGEEVGKIAYTTYRDSILLKYTWYDYWNEQTERVTLPIDFIYQPCHLGGQRAWLKCPADACQRRCGLLVQHGPYFVCKRCAGACNAVENESPIDRLHRKARKLEDRLFDGDNKKKWLHWKSYNKGLAEYERLGDAIDQADWSKLRCLL